jgi:poly(A) polymerase
MEMRRVLTEPGRVQGVRLLIELGLAAAVLPEIVPHDDESRARIDRALDDLGRLHEPEFPLALAALLAGHGPAAVGELGIRWKLSNIELDEAAWLVKHHDSLVGSPAARWSRVQPLFAHPWAAELVALHEVSSPAGPEEAAWCRVKLALPRDELDPPPLLTGDDLLAHGLQPGPAFKHILQAIRDAQLDGEIQTKEEALALALSTK